MHLAMNQTPDTHINTTLTLLFAIWRLSIVIIHIVPTGNQNAKTLHSTYNIKVLTHNDRLTKNKHNTQKYMVLPLLVSEI